MTDHHEHEDIRELLMPYALRELDDAAVLRVERALSTSPELRAELAGIDGVAARLLEQVPHVAAPPALRDRVLGTIGAVSPSHADTAREPAPAAVVSLSRRRALRYAVPTLTAASMAASLVLAFVAFSLHADLDAARSRADRAVAASGDRASDRSMLPMSTSGALAPASGVLMPVDERHWMLEVRNLPSPGAGHSWQVWTANANGKVQNVAQWTGAASMSGIMIDRPDVTAVMISLEPTTKPMASPSAKPVAEVYV